MMRTVTDDMIRSLEDYGAVSSQIVELQDTADRRSLRYADLVRASPRGGAPVVIESQGQPRLYVFRGVQGETPVIRNQWVRRIAFRGDADWMGVWRPGRLDVFRAVLDGRDAPTAVDVPAGPDLVPSLIHLPSDGASGHVRTKLLDLLRRSIADAKKLGVGPDDALSLIGRALFWRFLMDRGLLDGLRRDDVCSGAESWAACLASKENALQTFDWLDDTFNGGLLPFDSHPRRIPAAAFSTVVGNIAHGADADGQLSLQLPMAWREVNFAHVPVGLLSEVYEAFAHDESATQAKAESIFYTPRHIAELIVEDALEAIGEIPRPRVLDPAVGAGVFLIAMFRALVAREWVPPQKRPSRSVVRRILNEQLTGFDINGSALRLAELGLYLTAIELDPDPKPRPLKLLHFDPPLRDRALFKLAGGVDRGSLDPVAPRFRQAFDIVLGNPPWTASASVAAKKEWVRASRSIVADRLGAERAASFDLPQKNPDLAFVYRAMEWGKPGASIALVTHARWLFGQSPIATRARQDLLESIHVTGLLNGAALRDTNVWPNVRHPFAILFAINEKPPPGAAFLIVSPDLDQVPDGDQERLRMDWQDAREVVSEDVIRRPWTLKVRFRGGPFDELVVDAVLRRGVRLAAYLARLGTRLWNGYKVGGARSEQNSAQQLRGLPDLRGSEPDFFVDTSALPPFERPTLHRPRPRKRYCAPLLIISESMRVDAFAARASLSSEDLVFDERFDAVSFADVPEGGEIAAYLQLLLQSSLLRHALLMLDEQFGVEREVVHKGSIDSVPVIPWDALPSAHRLACQELSARLRRGLTESLVHDIDAFACDVFQLSDVERDAVRDTLSTALPTAEAKRSAVRLPSAEEQKEFTRTCQAAMQDVLSASDMTALVRLREDLKFGVWSIIQVDRYRSRRPALAELDPKQFLESADEAAASLVLVEVNPTTTLVGLLDRYRYWTATRARVLAATLLSEVEHDA